MSLDQNLFTLHIAPSRVSPPDIDLTDPANSDVLYRKKLAVEQSDTQSTYQWSFHDPLSGAVFATVSSPHSTSKKKTITLHDPDVPVDFSFSGSINFKWSFMWESQEFEWKKEECYMLRKPDPPVLVAVTKPESKGKPASVQILDYNINRFDIDDRKGLEIVILCGFLTFADYAEGHREPVNAKTAVAPSPPLPSNSASKSRPNFSLSEGNEIIVTNEGSIDDYAQHCASILATPDLLFIIIRAVSPENVSKVVKVAQETKRRRRRDENDDEELHQYVTYDQEDKEDAKGKKSLRVINLDDTTGPNAPKEVYQPPTSLTIHLSKIPMPELIPRAPHTSPSPQHSRNPSHNNILRDVASSTSHSKESTSELRRSPPHQNKRGQRPLSTSSPSTPAHGSSWPPQKNGANIPSKPTSSHNLRVDEAGNTLAPASIFSRRAISGSALQSPSSDPNGLHPGAQAYYDPRDFGHLGAPHSTSASDPVSQPSAAGGLFGKVFGKP